MGLEASHASWPPLASDPPALDRYTWNPAKMAHVFCHQDEVMLQSGSRDQDVRVTDELAALIEQGVDLSRLDNDVIRQRQHLALLTALFEASDLAGRTTGFQS